MVLTGSLVAAYLAFAGVIGAVRPRTSWPLPTRIAAPTALAVYGALNLAAFLMAAPLPGRRRKVAVAFD